MSRFATTTVRWIAGSIAALALAAPSWAQQGPTAEHKKLAELTGTYDAVVKSWYAPGSEPAESKGVEIRKMLGDFWLVADFKGNVGDAPFEGHGVTGYDPTKKKFVGTWVDTMTPSVLITEGEYDPATKTMTQYSEMVEPSSGQKMKLKMTTAHQDGKEVFTLSMGDSTGKEFTKSMEITYTKRP